MIEFKLSKDGQRYFVWNGLHLCSSFSPLKEAKKWCKKHEQQIGTVNTVFVLGGGCGFHLAELSKKWSNKRIVVIEVEKSFVVPLHELQGIAIANVEVLCATSFQELSLAPILESFESSYSVISFAPVTSQRVKEYNEIKDYLLGRSAQGLSLCRSLLRKSNERTSETQLPQERLASVNDLVKNIDVSSVRERFRGTFSVIREMVK